MSEEAKASLKKAVIKKTPAPKVSEVSAETEVHAKRERDGVVLSNKMQKTIIVQVTRIMEHPDFKKIIRRNVKYAVHDEKNEAKIGDKVRITETSPLSKTKRWRLVKVLEAVSK